MDVLLVRRYVFLVCLFSLLSYTSLASQSAFAAVTDDADGNFDETSYVETDTTTTSTINTNTSGTVTNNNNNVNNNTTTYTGTNTNSNTNVNTNTSTNTNTNSNTTNYTGTNTSTNTNTNNTNYTGNSTSTNTNTNNNTNTSTNTNNSTVNSTNNTNYNSTNNNTNTNTSTSTNTNTNNNNSTVNSTSQNSSDINTQSNNTNTNNNNTTSNNKNENINKNETVQKIEQDIKSPPPSAIAPSIGSSYSQDLCTVGLGGAVQTQLFGLSGGGSVRDENCERIKLSKTLYDMGMKVASVSLMCQDQRVWDAMRMAGTPCPYEGKIGEEAQAEWDNNPSRAPKGVILSDNSETLESDKDTEYRVWSKEEFCEKYPKEKVCK
jgi:hypothetical protein